MHLYDQTIIWLFIRTFWITEVTQPEITGRKYAIKVKK